MVYLHSRALGIEDEHASGVYNSLDFIAKLRQTEDLTQLHVGNDIVVIGAGNTAIDIACQTKRLGAENVTLVYRKGEKQMSATDKEQAFAKQNGIRILTWAQPHKLNVKNNQIQSLEFERTELDDNDKLIGKKQYVTLAANMVFKAIGQSFNADCFAGSAAPLLTNNRIAVDEQLKTSLDKVWAGGDCIALGEDLTVQAVAHGKQAAESINEYLGTVPK